MSQFLLSLIFVFSTVLVATSDAQLPKFNAFSLEQSKAKALELANQLGKQGGAEIVTDSNTLLIHFLPAADPESLGIVTIKCLFNKKNSIQALNITFSVNDAFVIEALCNKLSKRLGNPDKKVTKLGFTSEQEWTKRKGFSANFFSSEQERESYLLLGTPAFMREENQRSRPPQ